MESMSPPPSKKIRLLDIEIPFIECRREFKLPQQFPSMVPSVKLNGTPTGKNVTNTASASGISKTLKDSTGKEVSVTNGLKKLRIRSQDGRDLGEVKVKILPQDSIFNTKNIILAKSNVNNITNKPIKFSIIPSNNADKLSYLSKGTEGFKAVEKLVASSNKLLAVAGNGKSTVEDNGNKFIGKSVLLSKPLSRLDEDDRVYDKKVLAATENGHKVLYKVQSPNNGVPKLIKIPACPPLIDIRKNGDLFVKTKSIHNVDKFKPNDNAPEILNKTDVLNVEKFPKDHLELAKSKFPVVKCEKLMLSKSKVNINELGKAFTKVDSNKIEEQNVRNNKTIQNLINTRFDESKECNTNTQTKLISSVMQKPKAFVQKNDSNKTTLENSATILPNDRSILVKSNFNKVQRENYTLTHAANKNVCNGTQNIPNDTNNKPVSSSHGKTYNNEHMQSENLNLRTTVNGTNNIKETVNNAPEQEKLSQQWNIIKEALISVKDEELRTKALQALADCGIGLPKHVPIIPPENMKTVHESQVQTDVFGLLDLESFVLVRKEQPTLQRIKQTERSTSATETNSNVPVRSRTKWNNYIDNEDLLQRLNPMYSIDNIELDSCFNEYFNGNTDVNKVKQILSAPHSLYKKVTTQLQKDFEALHSYDENGMLNIHRAVINNNLREIQRLLLVLKVAKTSIDVETEDGMTSLELAVKYNSPKDIMHTLLEAGAKPTSTQLLRESPVILASKSSSPLLPYLLQYVTDRKLLNQVDSEGFGALHYCALYGNLEGVTALLEAGTEVNLKDNRSGRTPFFHAVEQSHISVAQKLLEYGAAANTPNFAGQSVLSMVDDAKSICLKAALKQIIS